MTHDFLPEEDWLWYANADWIEVDHSGVQWDAFLNSILNLDCPKEHRKLCRVDELISCRLYESLYGEVIGLNVY
jgi:hypothetical protein